MQILVSEKSKISTFKRSIDDKVNGVDDHGWFTINHQWIYGYTEFGSTSYFS